MQQPTVLSTSRQCTCATPVPTERALRKGAAQTVCARCGLPVPLRLAR